MIDYPGAPNGFGGTWQRYVEHGISPGSFGTALLQNNLSDAIRRADSTNINLIVRHVKWLWINLPYEAWGSEKAVEKWVERGGLRGNIGNANDN